MTRLPLVTASQLIKLLEHFGFTVARSRGSHRILQHPDGRTTVVPVHKGKVLPRPLLVEILRQVGINRSEYLMWLDDSQK